MALIPNGSSPNSCICTHDQPMAIKGEREEEYCQERALDETVWARSPAPHTMPSTAGKKRAKYTRSADGTVWARSPAPHTAVNSKGKREQNIQERQ